MARQLLHQLSLSQGSHKFNNMYRCLNQVEVIQGSSNRGKRPSSGYPSPAAGMAPGSHPENTRKNLSLLDRNYKPEDQQKPSDVLTTPRPSYSPVTPSSVEAYLQLRTPGTPYLTGMDEGLDHQLGDFAPAGHLARLASNNDTALDCLQMLP